MSADFAMILVWLSKCLAIVFAFMLVENAARKSLSMRNTFVKYGLGFCLAVGCFWLTGYGLAFGMSFLGMFGISGFLPGLVGKLSSLEFALNQAGLAAFAMLIVFAAQARRMTLRGYVMLGLFFGLIVYPIALHWIWAGLSSHYGKGWLQQAGLVDQGGALAVHMLAGWAALASSLAIGPARFQKDLPSCQLSGKKAAAFSLLALGFFVYAGDMFLTATLPSMSVISTVVLQNLAIGALSAMAVGLCVARLYKSEFSYLYAVRLCAVGAVANLAGLDLITPMFAGFAGAIAAMVSVWMSRSFIHSHVEDGASTISIHLSGGMVGGLLVAFFGAGMESGAFVSQLLAQIQGVITISLFVFGSVFAFVRLTSAMTTVRLSDCKKNKQPKVSSKPENEPAILENAGKAIEQNEAYSFDELSGSDMFAEPKFLAAEDGTKLIEADVELEIETGTEAEKQAMDEEQSPVVFNHASVFDMEEDQLSDPLDLSDQGHHLTVGNHAHSASEQDDFVISDLIDEEALADDEIFGDEEIEEIPLDAEEALAQNAMLSRTLKRATIDLASRNREVQILNNQLNDLTSAFVVSERTKHSFFTLTQNIFNSHIQDMLALTIQSNTGKFSNNLAQMIQEKSIDHARNLAAIKAFGEAMEVTTARDQVDTDLRRLVESVKNKFADKLINSGILFHVRYDRKVLALKANPSNLRMMLEQLIEQALKHNTKGGLVHVDVRLDDAGGCIIEVVDSGKGLSPDALEEALDPLNLSDDPTRDVAMAIGYGLVQRLVNIHDGDMHVTSDPGVGSRVLVTWPKQKVRLAPLDISEQDAG